MVRHLHINLNVRVPYASLHLAKSDWARTLYRAPVGDDPLPRKTASGSRAVAVQLQTGNGDTVQQAEQVLHNIEPETGTGTAVRPDEGRIHLRRLRASAVQRRH